MDPVSASTAWSSLGSPFRITNKMQDVFLILCYPEKRPLENIHPTQTLLINMDIVNKCGKMTY